MKLSKRRCRFIIFDKTTKRKRSCKIATESKFCKIHCAKQHIDKTNNSTDEPIDEPIDEPNEVGTCCFCGYQCNPCSQSCGSCARKLSWNGFL